MRVLKFIVDAQLITPDPSCDFSGLVPGTDGYLLAEFSFSSEWSDCVKVAEFRDACGTEFKPQILKDGKSCMIPAGALENSYFKIRVHGRKKDYKITSNYVNVHQDGGGKV